MGIMKPLSIKEMYGKRYIRCTVAINGFFRWRTYSTARNALCPRMVFMALQCLPGSNKNDIKKPLRWTELLNLKIQRKETNYTLSHIYTHPPTHSNTHKTISKTSLFAQAGKHWPPTHHCCFCYKWQKCICYEDLN